MFLKIIDSYNELFSCYENGVFIKKRWEDYVENVYPGLKTLIENDSARLFEYKDEAFSVLNDVIKKFELSERAHRSFIKATEDLGEEILHKFKLDLDVTVIFYLGLCNAAGWATAVNGHEVILIGIEKVVELGWCGEKDMKALIYHELGHIYHALFERKKPLLTKKEQGIRQLYREGVAMVFEQTLCDDERFFHQDKDSWLEWCRENDELIKAEFLNRLKNRQSVQDFFGDWRAFMGRCDVGYYLGAVFVRYLMKDRSLKAVAAMKLSEVLKLFYEFVGQ